MKVFLLGGSGGIGQAIQTVFEERGCTVFAPSRAELDLHSQDSIAEYLNKRNIQYDSFDAIIHAAGYNVIHEFSELDDEEIHRSLQTNVLGFLRVIRPFMQAFSRNRKGHVLVFSSLYGLFARSGRLPYVLSKHALHGIVKTLALEFGSSNVLINGIAPGFVDTPMTRRNNDEATVNRIVNNIPLGRMANPTEIAQFAYFLCSKENSYITGQILTIDGGYSAGGFQR